MSGTDADDDFEDVPAPTPAPAAKPEPKAGPDNSRLKSRYVREAEELGLDQGDLDECANNAELLELIRFEREKQDARRNSAPAREVRTTTLPGEPGTGSPTHREPAASGAAKPDDDEDYEVEDPEGWIDERTKAEIKKLGKALKKAQKGTSTERIEKLEKLVEAQQQLLERQASRNHPLVREGNAAVAKYASLFGTSFDEDGVPSDRDSVEWFNHSKLMRYLFGVAGDDRYPAHLDPKLTPTENVARAVKALFKVAAPDGAAPPPESAAPGSRIAGWKDSGQAAPTNRNGSARTGIPATDGGDARKAKRVTIPEDDDDDI